MDKLGNAVYKYIPPENDIGDIEYKWKLININNYRINKLCSQMIWRVSQTRNKSALYIIGVHDNGYITGLTRSELSETFQNILECASLCDLKACVLKMMKLDDTELFWAVIQVFQSKHPCKNNCDDYDIPQVPKHYIPNYL